jgi:ATP phosphoribosyltransferase regulatory subunit
MRDLLPPEAAARAWLGSKLTDLFHRWGYDLVTTPPFEHAEVLERGLETVDRRDLLRFVEPETGEVALLRPDITPQIARIVATRLADRPSPWRLCYSGSVIRQRRGRARTQRQIAQAGVEHVGGVGVEADAEVIALAAASLESVGLSEFTIELHLVGLARRALAEVPEAARAAAELALTRKDGAELIRILSDTRINDETRRRLLGAAELYGGVEVLREAAEVFGPPAEAPLVRLRSVVDRLTDRGLVDRLALDLGDVRGASYYTGVSFTLLAPGPGEPLGSGGRYDDLLSRFGLDAPATGFGLDLANVEWALATAGRAAETPRPVRFVVCGEAARREEVSRALRDAERVAAVLHDASASGALDYARAWGYDAAVVCQERGAQVLRAADGQARDLDRTALDELARWVRSDERSEG